MRRIIFLLIMCVACACQAGYAQQAASAADKLYAQGVTYMKTLTVPMQRKAIAAFGKAKVAYDSKAKKDLCDEQIAVCNGIIRKLTASEQSAQSTVSVGVDNGAVKEVATENVEITAISEEAEISVHPTTIQFTPKCKKYVEVSVRCSGEGWKIVSCPEWISCITSSNTILMKAEKNNGNTERAGFVTIAYGNKKVDIVVRQSVLLIKKVL